MTRRTTRCRAAGTVDHDHHRSTGWRRLGAGCVAATATLALAAPVQAAPDPAGNSRQVARYTFADGAGTDVTGHGHPMALLDGATVRYDPTRRSNVLDLAGDGQYAQIPDDVFAQVGSRFTLSFSAVSRSPEGNFFTVAVGSDDTHYLMVHLSTSGMRAVLADDGWRHEEGPTVSADGSGWHDYRLVVRPGSVAVYRDGLLLGYDDGVTLTMASLPATTTLIGKSFYADDSSWNGSIDDLTVRSDAPTTTVPTGLTVGGSAVDQGAVRVEQGAGTTLTTTFAPAGAAPTAVTWSSSNPAVAGVDANGVVTTRQVGGAVVTATSKVGGATGSVAVTVTRPGADQQRRNLQADADAATAALPAATTENLALPTTGSLFGSTLTWRSSDPARITPTRTGYQPPAVGAADPYRGGGVVTRNAYGRGDATATLTVTASGAGRSMSGAPRTVTVPELARHAPDAGYASANFGTVDGRDQEQVWISSTDRNDFFSFQVRNGGNPAVTSNADTGGLRDPFVLRSHFGDRWYMLATDLDTSAGDWGYYGSHGSLKVEVWESTDLVHWSRTNGEGNGGITVNTPAAGMTWAPEAFWDDTLQSYVVYFASTLYSDADHTTPVPGANGGGYSQVLMATTRDFRTFTPVVPWQDTGYDRIDSTVFRIGDWYYRLTKNSEPGADNGPQRSNVLERSAVLTAPTTTVSPANDPTRTWQVLDQNVLMFEGPESVQLNPGDPNQNSSGDAMVLLSDVNVLGGYIPFMTSRSAVASTDTDHRLSTSPGWFDEKPAGPGVTGRVSTTGLPSVRRHGAFFNVPQTVLDATRNWTGIQPVASATTARYRAATRTVTVQVTAADGGEVAGTVAVSNGAWSATVTLTRAGSATVKVPADVAGTLAVAYRGYRDGLVRVSSTQVGGVTVA